MKKNIVIALLMGFVAYDGYDHYLETQRIKAAYADYNANMDAIDKMEADTDAMLATIPAQKAEIDAAAAELAKLQ